MSNIQLDFKRARLRPREASNSLNKELHRTAVGRRSAEQREPQHAPRNWIGKRGSTAAGKGKALRVGLHAGRHGGMHRHAKWAVSLIGRPGDSIGLQGDPKMSMGQPIAVDVRGLCGARNQHQQEAENRRQPHPEGMSREKASGLTLLDHRV